MIFKFHKNKENTIEADTDLYEVPEEVVQDLVDSADEEIAEAASEIIEEATEPVLETVEDVTEPVIEAIEDVSEPVADEVEEIAEPVIETVEDVVEPAEEMVEVAAEDTEEAAEEIIEEVSDITSEEPTTSKKGKKAKKAKKEKPAKAEKKGKKSAGLFGIRNKIFLSFIVPIAFMILVGLLSYRTASEGMSESFTESTEQTAKMAIDYLDINFKNVQADGMSYAFDAAYNPYFLGSIKEAFKKANFNKETKVTLMAAQDANEFVNDIHFIGKPGIATITTATEDKPDGIMDSYVESMTTALGLGAMEKWVDSHAVLDENLSIDPNSYFMAFQSLSSKRNYVVVIDLSNDAVKELLNGLDFGEGSSIAFITPSGKQVRSDSSEDIDFTQLDFYTGLSGAESKDGETNTGSGDVQINGKNYVYIYAKSNVSGVTFCSVIPESIVTGQAEVIKTRTVELVIIAMIIALLIGFLVANGIQSNMKRISAKMDEVAKGDLSVEVKAKGRDEFQTLASTATNMISNNRKLVGSLSRTAGQLETSVDNVYGVSEDINTYSADITNAIDEIGIGMNRQAQHAEECIIKTNTLSNKIENISGMIEDTAKLAGDTESKIDEGKGIVEQLITRSTKTTEITDAVGDSVIRLKEESQVITGFADTIQEISDQTNLLSLNASIEAARAGEAGRGFSVVAEEIRKLADQSAEAAVQIKKQVEAIITKTEDTVQATVDAREMVQEESEFVEKVSMVFDSMREQMEMLFEKLRNVAENAEATSADREATLDAVESISAIIQQTSASSQLVRGMAEKLHENVERLSETAGTLDEDMNNLKEEITVFKLD